MKISHIRYLLIVLLLFTLSGCGVKYLHLKDGTALECKNADYLSERDIWMVRLTNGRLVEIDDKRVREYEPLSGSKEGSVILKRWDADISGEDIRRVSDALSESLMESAPLNSSKVPVIAILFVENQTHEHFPTNEIPDWMMETLLKKGKAKFVDTEIRDLLLDEIDYETGDFMNPALVQTASFNGVDYFLYGHITSIQKTATGTFSSAEQNYYRLSMNLVEVSSSLVVWKDSEEWYAQKKTSIYH